VGFGRGLGVLMWAFVGFVSGIWVGFDVGCWGVLVPGWVGFDFVFFFLGRRYDGLTMWVAH
jgi:hypothetical protein